MVKGDITKIDVQANRSPIIANFLKNLHEETGVLIEG